MKLTMFKYCRLTLFLFFSFSAFAQKLPNKQEFSLRAPTNIKIDGKSTEWNDQFQAYNKAVELYYTIANDDDNLYLIVKATNPRIIDKIIDVGITVIINSFGKKNDEAKENISITYPIIDVANGQRVIINAGNKVKSDIPIPILAGRPVILDTTDRLPTRNDSLIAFANKLLDLNAKMIKVTGITEISDDLISVYNEEKIRVAGMFDKSGAYTYELSIPIKYLKISLNDMEKFSYSIKLNSRLVEPKRGMNTRYIYKNGERIDVDQDLDSTTDFWDYYVMLKK